MDETKKSTESPALLKQAFLAVQEMQAKLAAAEMRSHEPIAIVGLGCRFPGGVVDDETFWSLLREGRDAISIVPQERWDADAYYDPDPDKPGKMVTRSGGFLDHADQFDARFFEIAPREAASMDPQQRLALEVAWEALENAGISPADLRGTDTGVFLGIASNDYSQLYAQAADPERLDPHYASGIAHSIASGRISYLLGLEGPSVSLDTACSSSLVAVHLACQSLRAGDCTMALAGGVNLMLAPETTVLLSHVRMLSPGGRCKAFDNSADGFVRGEGCGFVALKTLSQARADGNRILAVIRGTAVNQDGASSSLTAPNGPSQVKLMRQALANAGVQANEVSYIEAHGTGTALGDPIELQALGAVYGATRAPDHPLHVGSLKTNIGHLEAAAGIAGFIKAVLALQHRQIPPHLHLQQPTAHVRWDELRLTVPRRLTDWNENGNKRIAAVSSFGFSGTNAHVVLEEAPPIESPSSQNERPLQILAVSAKSTAALQQLALKYREALENAPTCNLRDFCFTANTGRSHFPYRACLLATDADEMKRQLAEIQSSSRPQSTTSPRICFLFTGQGSQYVGMGGELYGGSEVYRAAMERCEEAWKQETGESLIGWMYGEEGGSREQAEQRMQQARYAQPALYALEYGLAELWRSWGIEPSVVLGHSLGEYVAAVVAGVYSVEDGMGLVCARARLMDSLREPGGMRAVAASAERVEREIAGLEGEVGIGVINGAENVVLSGRAETVERVGRKLESEGIRTRRLEVTHGFHSPQLEPILEEFERCAEKVKYHAPRIRMISNLTGEVAAADEITTPRYWREHMRRTVQFDAGLKTALASGCQTLLEIGPQPHLLSLGKSAHGDPDRVWLPSVRRGRDPWLDLLASVKALYELGADIHWKNLHGRSGRPIALPTYPFERQRHWFVKKSMEPVASSPRSGEDRREAVADSFIQSFYEIAWVPVPVDVDKNSRMEGSCILCGGGLDFLARFSAALEKNGTATTILAQTQWSAEKRREFYDDALQAAPGVRNVIYFALSHAEAGAAQDSSAALQLEGLRECLELTQALLRMNFERTPRLWIITRGAQGPTLSNISQAPLLGFARSLAAEHPELRPVCLDLDPEGEPAVDQFLCAIAAAEKESELVLRGRQLFATRLRRAPQCGETAAARIIRNDSAYLVTGGLAGIGLEVTTWLAEQGAGQVILMGRRSAEPEAARRFQRMRERGTVITECRGDVIREADIQAALRMANAFPLRGVFHCAGVLDEDGATLLQQDWARFWRVLSPKIEGVSHLDRLTGDIPLDHFVLFSSAGSLLGSPGHSSYAAANAFLDAMARQRSSRGLPGLSINWGPWKDTGMAVRHQLLERGSKIGMCGFSVQEGLRAMGSLMAGSESQAMFASVDWNTYFASVGANFALPMLRELRGTPSEGAQVVSSPKTQSWLPQLETAVPATREPLLLELLERRAQVTLGLPAGQKINPDQPLQELGLDSLLSIELRNGLSACLEHKLPATLLFNYPTLNTLAAFISREVLQSAQLEAGNEQREFPDHGRSFSPAGLVDDIESLSDEEVDRLLTTRAEGVVR